MGRLRESLEEAERAYRLDALDPMTANQVALARMAAGRVAEAVPVYEDLVERAPGMSFPVSSLLRCYAFQQDWPAVDRLLALAAQRQLREFEAGLPFIRAKRHPTLENIESIRSELEAHVDKTGCVDIARLVYAAHLGLVEEAYQAAERAHLGPIGTSDDVMGPDAYRTSLLFQAGMPEMRNDPRCARLCARLGLVEFWMTTDKWPDCAGEVPYDFKAECAKVRHVPKAEFGF
jgi:tetratricopeptide (TPR) repeat protein